MTTGGVERLEIGDLRLCSTIPVMMLTSAWSNDTHMLFVDAGNDRVGWTSSQQLLHVHTGMAHQYVETNLIWRIFIWLTVQTCLLTTDN